MRAGTKRSEQIERAAELAAALHRAGVSRAELRPVLNVLFLTPGAWGDRRDRARRLLEHLPESWVGNRSDDTRHHLASVRQTLRGLLAEPLAEDDCSFLLGWTARLLQVQFLAQPAEQNGASPARPRDPRRQR